MSRQSNIVMTIFLVFLGCLGLVGLWLEQWRAPTRAAWAQIQIGADLETVIQKLGTLYRSYAKSSAPVDYYVSGFGHKERPITGKVLIYMGRDLVLYLWFDEHGRVEDTFVGTS